MRFFSSGRSYNKLLDCVIGELVVCFSGSLNYLLQNCIAHCILLCCHGLVINFSIVLLIVGVCVFMFKLSWRLSMVTVVGLPVVMGISKLYGDYYEVW